MALAAITFTAQAQLHTKDKPLPCLNKTFSIYLHITVDSLREVNVDIADVEAAIAATSEAFDPICVNFELCHIDTLHNWTWDSLSRDYRVDEIKNLFYRENRINLFIVDRYDNPNVCGFANLGQIANPNNAVVHINKGCINMPTLAHELGHLFGLVHTFEGGDELVDGSNCETAGDGICDTPADPYMEGDITWLRDNCEFVYAGTDSLGRLYQPDVGNTMSYYDCSGCGFTRGQFLKMAETWLASSKMMW